MSVKHKGIYAYGYLTDTILESIASLFIESGRYVPPPRLGIIIGNIIRLTLEKKKKQVSEQRLKKTFHDLARRNILSIEEKNNKAYVHLLEKGNKRVIEYSLKQLIDFKKKNKRWNGKWFMVFFDVPERERNKRNYLRRYLKRLGFYQYQQSVYVFPYECENEIMLIKKIVKGAQYMQYIIAERIEGEKQAKIFFKL